MTNRPPWEEGMKERKEQSSLLYRGPAKPVRLGRWKLEDSLSARLWLIEGMLFVVGLGIVALDVFIWRP